MNIREAAEQTGLPAHTIRFYEKIGLLPGIERTQSGIRQFNESDITFIQFIASLRKTGMSLEDIAAFTEDGCILERLNARMMPVESVSNRMAILQKHRQFLHQQLAEIQMLMDAVAQKIDFYQSYLDDNQS